MGVLTAGIELDALVAEKDMGYTILRGDGMVYDGMPLPWVVFQGANGKKHNPISFSTDIAAAFQVVDAMRKQYGFDAHNNFLLTCDAKGWYCEFPAPKWEDAIAETESLAICLAALKAVGVEV